MSDRINRRDFVKSTGMALGAAALASNVTASAAPTQEGHMKKAVKIGMVREGKTLLEKFQLLKSLGYDGVEMDAPSKVDRDEVVAARDSTGLTIPGVVDSVHWRQTLSDPDPAVRERGLEGLRTALHDAKHYGATTVLLVPAVVNKDVSYADAYTRSQAEIRKALPLAEELGIKIAIENVWNQFLLSPLETARYIDEFESPHIGVHFDVGNVVNYGWPEQWIRILGPRVLKLDIKEYSRAKRDKEGPYSGFRVKIGDGDCDWPAVRKALADIGYSGWATAEVSGGDRERLADIAARMDKALGI
jgi:L-ribulose-5-phosphate 3-epimerase